MGEIPVIFRPTMIQSAESMQWEPWHLLTRMEFSHEEKEFLCKEIIGVTNLMEMEPCTATSVAACFGLKRPTISRWLSNYRKGRTQHPRSGCPACLDEQAEVEITQKTEAARRRHEPFSKFEIDMLMAEEAQMVGTKRKAGAYTRKEQLCANTIQKYLKKLLVIIKLS
jgi:transposase-like protein